MAPHSFKVPAYKDEKGRWGARIFALFNPKSNQPNDLVRSISLINDGGKWVFECHGELQEFERSTNYLATRIERPGLRPAVLAEYLSALGILRF